MTNQEKQAVTDELDELRRQVAMLLAGCTPTAAVLACARRLVARIERLNAQVQSWHDEVGK